MNILTISYGRHLFEEGNRERERMLACARHVDELHMVVFTRDHDNLKPEVVDGKLFLHPTASSGKFMMLRDAVRLGKKILKEKEAAKWVISAQDPFEAGFVGYRVARSAGVSFNVQEHGDFFSTSHWRQETILNRVRFHLGRFILKRAGCVRVVSDRITSTLEKLGVSRQKISKLSVVVDTTAFANAKPDARIRAAYPQKTIILSAARFVAQKNLTLLIESFAEVHKEHPETLLLLVGSGPEEAMLRKLARQLGIEESVVFMPWADDMPSLMKAADIYALSSNYEGWGRVLIEAMAAGVPIVTTDVGAAGEVLENGEHGRVVKVGDQEAFAGALGELVSSEQVREGYGTNARSAAQGFPSTNDAYAEEWTSVLRACSRS